MLLKIFLPLQNFALRYADSIIATSQNYVRYSQHLMGYKKKVKVVPLGISEPAEDKKTDLYSDKIVVLSIGRLVSYKGFQYLIESAKYLDENYLILIAGDGERRESLQKNIVFHQVQKKVELLGNISNEDKQKLLCSCDIFCLASTNKAEAFGASILEAMSFGKPIVSTNMAESGISWVNIDGRTGIQIDPKSPKQLANAFKKITSNQKLKRTMGENAKVRFENFFTSKKMVTSIIKIYKTI
jgi:rhamnosyl/mannosyltransferase